MAKSTKGANNTKTGCNPTGTGNGKQQSGENPPLKAVVSVKKGK